MIGLKFQWSAPIYQNGVTLIVALVILVVMSIVGVASMSSSNLQARMASNEKQQLMSQYAAEAGVQAAKRYLDDNVGGKAKLSKFKSAGEGLYSGTASNSIDLPWPPVSVDATFPNYLNGRTWNDTNSVEVTEANGSLPSSVLNSRYIIELVGQENLSPTFAIDPTEANTSDGRFVFKITAVGWGQDTRIYSVIQSTYRTAPPGDFDY